MSAFTILIRGKNSAGAAFKSAEKEMSELNKRAMQLKRLFVSGAIAGTIIKIGKAIMSTTTRGEELAAAGEKAKNAWRDVGAVIADGMASAAVWIQGVSVDVAGGIKKLMDDARGAAAYITARVGGASAEEARSISDEAVGELNREQSQRRWQSDDRVKKLEEKRAALADAQTDATARLVAIKEELAQEEAKLAGLGDYDLERVPVLNKIVTLYEKQEKAIKDVAEAHANLRETTKQSWDETVEGQRMRVEANEKHLDASKTEVRKSAKQRREERRAERLDEKEAKREENRLRVAQAEIARASRRGPRGRDQLSDRYASLLVNQEAVDFNREVLDKVEKDAGKAMREFDKENPGIDELKEIKANTGKLLEVLEESLRPA